MRRTTSADKSALVWQVRKGSIDSPCNLWHLLWRWKPLTHITGMNRALYAAYDIVDELLAEVWLQKSFISEVLYMCCVLKWICNNSSSFREPNEIIALTWQTYVAEIDWRYTYFISGTQGNRWIRHLLFWSGWFDSKVVHCRRTFSTFFDLKNTALVTSLETGLKAKVLLYLKGRIVKKKLLWTLNL